MSSLLYLIPAALVLGVVGLAAFLWALRGNQFDDLEGAQHRILFDDDENPPPSPPPANPRDPDHKVASDQGSGAR